MPAEIWFSLFFIRVNVLYYIKLYYIVSSEIYIFLPHLASMKARYLCGNVFSESHSITPYINSILMKIYRDMNCHSPYSARTFQERNLDGHCERFPKLLYNPHVTSFILSHLDARNFILVGLVTPITANKKWNLWMEEHFR